MLIYLFFSVNESRRFCGVAQMASPVDLRASLPDWSFTETHRWKGSFAVQVGVCLLFLSWERNDE